MTTHHFHRRPLRPPTAWAGSGLGGAPARATCGFMGFPDRRTAGRILADWVRPLVDDDDAIVVGVAGGGLVVASEVASELDRPLDRIVVQAVTVAGFPCEQVAAIAEDGSLARDDARASQLGLGPDTLQSAVRRAQARLDGRCWVTTGAAPIEIEDRRVLLVDEALDSGMVALAAVASLKRRGAATVRVAVPVGDRAAVASVARVADDVVAVLKPEVAGERQRWYQDLPVISDAEVAELLGSRFTLR